MTYNRTDDGFTLAEMLASLFVISLVTVALATLTRQYANILEQTARFASLKRSAIVAEAKLSTILFVEPTSRKCGPALVSGFCVGIDGAVKSCAVSISGVGAKRVLTIRGAEESTTLAVPFRSGARLECTTSGVAVARADQNIWRPWVASMDLGL
jgi:prepilin-type N-terminal cleavage/methylation domain-containing protein